MEKQLETHLQTHTNSPIDECPFIPDPPEPCINEIQLVFKPVFPLVIQTPLVNTNDVYLALYPLFRYLLNIQEMFVVLYLNNNNKVIGYYSLSVGGLTGTVADIRLILGIALKSLATGIILAHNHPSGNPKPSQQDEYLNERFINAANLLNIKVLDHIILAGENTYFSFAEEGIF